MTVHAGSAALRWLREVGGLTQSELAARSGVSERTIRSLERGTVNRPRRASLEELARAAGLGESQTATFLRAWAPDRERSLAELMKSEAPVDEIIAEATLQAEIEECLVASWLTFVVDADRHIRACRCRCVVEAQHDGIDSYLVPLMGDDPGETPSVEVVETVGCSVRQVHTFPTAGLAVVELALNRSLERQEALAFEFALRPADPSQSLFGDPRALPEEDTMVRVLHRVVELTVMEIRFEADLPATVWEIESIGGGEQRRLRVVPPDQVRRLQLTKRHARPGYYGFEWSWPPQGD